jgi:hypothetical protein
VIVSVPIKVYRLNGRQMILAEGSKAEEGQAPKALNLPLITSIASPCFSSHCHRPFPLKLRSAAKSRISMFSLDLRRVTHLGVSHAI